MQEKDVIAMIEAGWINFKDEIILELPGTQGLP